MRLDTELSRKRLYKKVQSNQMVKDHRTNVETSQIDQVLGGNLDEFIEAEIKMNAEL